MTTEKKNHCKQTYTCKCKGDYNKCVFGKRHCAFTHCKYYGTYTGECLNMEARE